jgi:hypothetical protein
MKPLTTSVLSFILFVSTLSAQIIPVKNPLQTDIARVLNDYPSGFKNISGEEMIQNPQTIEYESRITVKDAKCRVIRYSANTKEIYSWEAEMLKTDDFEEASKKFRSLYNMLHNLSADINGTTAVFAGEYIKPSEAIKFTNIVFNPTDKTPGLKNLKIALLLENEMLEWVVKIQVYEREREDKERGREKD